ncbi:MAG TPA: FecR domain-containing protein [Polyangiaceae bacterium]|nr:FecR domain-containing protein [Polyangiaceae bacterium]
MRDRLDDLTALARERAAGEVSREEHSAGRQRLLRRAAQTGAEQKKRRPLLWVFGFCAAAAAIALVFGFVRTRPLRFEVTGAASSTSNYLSAAHDRAADVRFSDGSTIHAEPGSRLRIDQARNDGARVSIERGAATASVKHAERSNWQFLAGPFEVRVTGTRFRLSWDPQAEEVDLVLLEGSVEVEGPLANSHFAVRAGQRFRASLADGSMRVESSIPKPPTAAATSEAPSGQAPPPSTATGDSPLTHTAPRNKVPASAPSNESAHESWPELVRRGKFDAVVRSARSRGIDACLASSSAADVRALADAARYAGQSALATQSLLALRRRFASSSDGNAAAFLLGRVDESSGQLAAADSWYDTYLRESPNGQFASDALAGRMRTVSSLRGTAAAKPLARTYLQRYPNGVHAPAAKKLGGLD